MNKISIQSYLKPAIIAHFKGTMRQFSKFAVVGVISTVINYLIFYLLLEFAGVNYLLSSGVGYICGVFAGFLLNKYWTFNAVEEEKGEIVRYYIIYLLSLGLSLGFLKITVEYFSMDARIANILAIGITTCTNFIGSKYFVFRK